MLWCEEEFGDKGEECYKKRVCYCVCVHVCVCVMGGGVVVAVMGGGGGGRVVVSARDQRASLRYNIWGEGE